MNLLKQYKTPVTLGGLSFSSPFLLAPMAAIGNAPFRLLMQELGSGGSISEFISCNGILHHNRRTEQMLRIHSKEQNVGIQLFGDCPHKMAQAIEVVLGKTERQGKIPDFIDINLGCPVRKVVGRGAGAALLKDPLKLGTYLETIKKNLPLPLTIKIRTGWDRDTINSDQVCHVARESGVSVVSIHGRTRAQGYRDKADWNYIEWLTQKTSLPIIGNGDLHQPHQVQNRWNQTRCQALMIARGCLRNPFIFLESYGNQGDQKIFFTARDHLEVLQHYQNLVCEFFEREPTQVIQVRKLVMWFAAGFPRASEFRSKLFGLKKLKDLMNYTEDYLSRLENTQKAIDYSQDFMMSGHG